MTSTIAWRTSLAEHLVWVEPEVDGVLLSTLAARYEKAHAFDRPGGYGPMAAGIAWSGDLDRYLFGEQLPDDETKVALLGCGCGEAGCWPLLARVTVERRTVLWDEFEQPFEPERDYSDFGPFRFRRDEYEEAAAPIVRIARNAL